MFGARCVVFEVALHIVLLLNYYFYINSVSFERRHITKSVQHILNNVMSFKRCLKCSNVAFTGAVCYRSVSNR